LWPPRRAGACESARELRRSGPLPGSTSIALSKAAQELQFLYARSRDRADARHRLYKILDRVRRSDVPELTRLGRTLDAW
jgi:hypothetical protein